MTAYSFSCPHCRGYDIRRARSRGVIDWPKMLVGIYPFRCVDCGKRFSGNVLTISSNEYANCPKCFRLQVEACSPLDCDCSAWDQLWAALGAAMYRCNSCLTVFTSRKDPHPSVRIRRYLAAPANTAGAAAKSLKLPDHAA